MSWYAHDIEDYDADTMHLSAAEDGIYSRLLRFYYKSRLPLPDNDRALASIARVGLAEWLEVAGTIRAFFKLRNGKLHQKHCDQELDRQDKMAYNRSEKAKRAATKRWSNNKDINATSMLDACSSHAQSMLGDATYPLPCPLPLESSSNEEVLSPEKQDGLAGKKGNGHDTSGPAQMLELWNQLAGPWKLPVARSLDAGRRRACLSILKTYDLENVKEALDAIRASPFCRGQNDRGWRADFDFLLQPKSFRRLLEGGYSTQPELETAE